MLGSYNEWISRSVVMILGELSPCMNAIISLNTSAQYLLVHATASDTSANASAQLAISCAWGRSGPTYCICGLDSCACLYGDDYYAVPNCC